MSIALKRQAIVFTLVLITIASLSRAAETDEEYVRKSALLKGLAMTSFDSRNFDTFSGFVESAFAFMRPDDPNRIALVMALAKLGKPEAEKALAYLDSWTDSFSGDLKYLCIGSMGDIYLFYLDQPEKAIPCFEKVMAESPRFSYFMAVSLFSVYSGHKRMFNIDKMEYYLSAQRKNPGDFRADLNTILMMAAKGDKKEALREVELLEEEFPANSKPVMKVYTAPIWGWIGDVEKVLEGLEPGLKLQARMYARGGFDLYCDWIQQSPAFNSVREDRRFIDMWDRLSKYEPEAQGSEIAIPGFDR